MADKKPDGSSLASSKLPKRSSKLPELYKSASSELSNFPELYKLYTTYQDIMIMNQKPTRIPRTGLPIIKGPLRPNMKLDARQRAVLQTIWALNIVERDWLDRDGYFILRTTAFDLLDNIFTNDDEVSWLLSYRNVNYRIFPHYSTSLDNLENISEDAILLISIRKRIVSDVFYAMLRLAGPGDCLTGVCTFPEKAVSHA